MGTLFRDLLVSGDLGGANDPYTFVLPSQSDFMNTFSFNSAGTEFSYASIAADREYRVARLERLFDVISELAELGLITFTQAADKMWVNEVTLRNLLGGGGSRPVLSEATTLTENLEVHNLTWTIEGHRTLLENISLTARPTAAMGSQTRAGFHSGGGSPPCGRALSGLCRCVGRVWVGPLAGVLAESIGWPTFFIVSTVAALPALWMLWWMRESVRLLEVDPTSLRANDD